MAFVWQPSPENGDLVRVAGWFAAAVAADDWDEALRLACMAEDIFEGGFVHLDRDDGGCEAMTRNGYYCSNSAAPGECVCAQHLRLIERHYKADA